LLNFYRFLICLFALISAGLIGLGINFNDKFFFGVSCLFFIAGGLTFLEYRNRNVDPFRKL
ncbi:hypothetical protein, partial [Acinetobacter sp. F9]|uniref:hypothetical protein n=1 Tax=Acinetobacter sp. F9 TaxID=2853158 RepID=UPI001C444368